MRRFPDEFEALLTPRGRKILAGHDPAVGVLADPDRPFVTLVNVVDPKRAEACRKLLERHLLPLLEPMDRPIDPDAIAKQTRNYADRINKTARVWTAYLDRRRSQSYAAAEDLGVTAMLQSESCVAFAAAISGRALARKGGMQVLCYGPGDYAGPHNDHHPEDPEARDGYVDLHVSLASDAVDHQWLVYEQGGHLSGLTSVNRLGGVNVYRLPFWHYVTPLVAKAGRAHEARRWLLLGTFLHAGARARTAVHPPQKQPATP